jgi:hypothetical protein
MKSTEECCAILGIAPTDDKAQIKAAFRRRALQFHPDTGGGTTEASARFILLRNAYETLLLLEGSGDRADTKTSSRVAPRQRAPSAPGEEFARQLNSLLWDMEDLFRDIRRSRNATYFGPRVQRDLLVVLVGLDKHLLTDFGLRDNFMTARGLPPVDPESYVDRLTAGTKISLHFPYTSVENYFFDIRMRMNQFLSAPALLHDTQRLQRYLDAYRVAVYGVSRIRDCVARDVLYAEDHRLSFPASPTQNETSPNPTNPAVHEKARE